MLEKGPNKYFLINGFSKIMHGNMEEKIVYRLKGSYNVAFGGIEAKVLESVSMRAKSNGNCPKIMRQQLLPARKGI